MSRETSTKKRSTFEVVRHEVACSEWLVRLEVDSNVGDVAQVCVQDLSPL